MFLKIITFHGDSSHLDYATSFTPLAEVEEIVWKTDGFSLNDEYRVFELNKRK